MPVNDPVRGCRHSEFIIQQRHLLVKSVSIRVEHELPNSRRKQSGMTEDVNLRVFTGSVQNT